MEIHVPNKYTHFLIVFIIPVRMGGGQGVDPPGGLGLPPSPSPRRPQAAEKLLHKAAEGGR